MKIIKPSFEILTQNLNEYLPALKLIERAGRTCYKSEENMNEDSAIKFCNARLHEDRGRNGLVKIGGNCSRVRCPDLDTPLSRGCGARNACFGNRALAGMAKLGQPNFEESLRSM